MTFDSEQDKTNVHRSFKSLAEFRLLEELPGAKPLAVVTGDGIISYATNMFEKEFDIPAGDSIEKLESEPPISLLVSNLVKSKYRAIQVEASVKNCLSPDLSGYILDIERIIIEDEEYLFILFTSATERKQFESRINVLHNALDYGGVPVIILDRQGAITYATKSFEQILDKKIEEMYRYPLPEVLKSYITPEDYLSLAHALEMKTSWIKVITHGEHEWYKELRLSPVVYQYSGVNNFILTAQDITSYMQKNALIKASEKRLRSIINNISDVLVIVRQRIDEYNIESANDNFFSLYDCEKEATIGTPLAAILQPDLYSEVLYAIHNIENSDKLVYSFQYRDVAREREYQVKITYTDDTLEKIRFYIVSLADITEQVEHEERLRKAYEKENQLNKLKSAFLANMSHEIRTPSMAIVGYANLLCDDAMGGYYDSIPEMTGYLKDGIKRLLKLIDNIVEVSMIESGDYGFEFSEESFNTLILNSIEELLPLASDRKIALHTDFEDVAPAIEIDPIKAKKIIEAVVDNAIKYNIPGGSVFLKTIYSDENVAFYCTDTGRGIEEKKLETILQPFVQEEDEGHKRRYEGAGLGLTIAYRLTLALRGEFRVRSKPNEGTTVIIKFPLRQK